MNSNFISKTLKTFLTSLVISIFVFGSFYFLLSDSSSETQVEEKTSVKESSKKLVIEEEATESSPLENSAIDVKKEVLGVTNTSNNQPVQIGGMLAQISDNYDNLQTTPTAQLTTPTTVVTVTLPTTTTTATTVRTATGVPATGNEGLYVLMAVFSIISGILITNGKDLAMRNFEK